MQRSRSSSRSWAIAGEEAGRRTGALGTVTVTTLQRVLQALLQASGSRSAIWAQILEGHRPRPPRTPSSVTTAGRACPLAAVASAVLAAQSRRRRRPADRDPVGRNGSRPSPNALMGPGEDKQLAMAPVTASGLHPRRPRRVRTRRHGGRGRGPADRPRQIRPYVRSIIERFRGQTVVMSQNEMHPKRPSEDHRPWSSRHCSSRPQMRSSPRRWRGGRSGRTG
jgi:flagellar biosynthesis protein FlhA